VSASSKARQVQQTTGLAYTAALKLVTGERVLTSVVKDCVYRDALEDLFAQTILRRWARRTNQVIPEPTKGQDGLWTLDLMALAETKGTGSTPAKARLDAVHELTRRDPTLAPTTPQPPAKEIVICDCARCDP